MPTDRMLILFIFSMATLSVPGQELSFTRRGEKVWFSGATCREVESELPNFETWTQRTNPEIKCQTKKVVDGIRCVYDITRCVPEHVRTYSGENALVEGPNCYNSALVLSQIVPHLRYSTSDEISFYLRPPICKEIDASAPRRPGDIGAYRIRSEFAAADQEFHAFIYVSDKVVYSKNGMRQEQPYALNPIQFVQDEYGFTPNNSCTITRDGVSKPCKRIFNVFRCKTMQEYLNESGGMPAELKEIFDGFNSFEGCLEGSIRTGESLSGTAKNNIVEVARALSRYLYDARSAHREFDEKTTFLLGALQMRLESIALQFKKIGESTNLLEFAHDIGQKVPRNLDQ